MVRIGATKCTGQRPTKGKRRRASDEGQTTMGKRRWASDDEQLTMAGLALQFSLTIAARGYIFEAKTLEAMTICLGMESIA
ncbi:hypothetical protein E5676_scaffold629G00460 [Cucumis melo var. makuwa]|uniref:Uncharacterized protein n=1 Tax=Cucumis melo var. makuwa TaxID=1194695 RepID=A0A5D3DXC6_CUCMM|nr:hypothetical protein E5676_scaffold629G00460 [Cucumis melo var. makuwa]